MFCVNQCGNFFQHCQCEKQNHCVKRKHNRIFDNPCGKKDKKPFSVEHGNPKRVEKAVDNQLGNQLGKGNAPQFYGFFIQKRTVNYTCEHRVKRKAEEKRTAWFNQIFQDVKHPAENRADNRTEQKLNDAVWNTGKADADVEIGRAHV